MAVTIVITVIPSSGRTDFFLDATGRIKCHLKSAPEKGKANKELAALIAKALGIAKLDVEIIGGLTSRTKRVRILASLTEEQIKAKLGFE